MFRFCGGCRARFAAGAALGAALFAGVAFAGVNLKDLKLPAGCEWRQWAPRVEGAVSRPHLYCRDSNGAPKGVGLFQKEFEPGTLERARADDAKAIGVLGNVFYNSELDGRLGVELLTLASGLGDNAATRRLAVMKWNPRDDAERQEVLALYRLAASRGDAQSMTELADAYDIGSGVKQDAAEALRLYRQAAEAGDPGAMVKLGKLCETDGCPAKDSAQARQWYSKAADAGNVDGVYALSATYRFGPDRDLERAEEIYARAAALKTRELIDDVNSFAPDDPAGSYFENELADRYLVGSVNRKGWRANEFVRQVPEAIRWYTLAAEHGSTDAARSLQNIYESGRDVAADKAAAAHWAEVRARNEAHDLLASAESGDMQAMKRLAAILLGAADKYEPVSLPKDEVAGAKWLIRAAAAGDAESMMAVSRLYAEGKGVAKDVRESERWAASAAEADAVRYMPYDDFVRAADKRPGYEMIMFAIRIAGTDHFDDSVFWYYEGMLRIRAYHVGKGEPPEQEDLYWALPTLPIVVYGASDPAKLVATIDRVLAWDAAHDDPFAPKAAHGWPRQDLQKYRSQVVAKIAEHAKDGPQLPH